MKKRLLSTLLALCMVLSLLPGTARAAAATSGTCGTNLRWELDTSTMVLSITGSGAMSDYYSGSPWQEYASEIKEVVLSQNMTSIGAMAFLGCTALKSVDFPSSLTKIGNSAFSNCSGLTDVNIPDTVISVGDMAFINCAGLISARAPAQVISNGKDIFSGCTSLTDITIPVGTTAIGSGMFNGCSSLTSVTIPNGVTCIQSNAFSNCSGLKTVSIQESVESIEEAAFAACTSLSRIDFPDGLKSIGYRAFSGCTGLNKVSIPDTVTDMGKTININYPNGPVFSGCPGLTSAGPLGGEHSIQYGWTDKLPAYAFYGCTSLTSIEFPDSMSEIGDQAFYGCTGLTSIEFPDSVSEIGNEAFYGCTRLTKITLLRNVSAIGEDTFTNCRQLTIYCYQNSYVHQYAVTHNIPFVLLDNEPEESGPVSITFWEDEACTRKITSMYTTYGSFSWGDVDAAPVGVSYDSAYIRLDYDPLSSGEAMEGLITAPRGFSFSPEKMERDWEFSVSAEDLWPTVEIYPIYDESYQDNDILTFRGEIARIDSDGAMTLEMTSIDTIPVHQNPHSGEVYYRDSFEKSGETLIGPMQMGTLDFSVFRTASSAAPYDQDLARLSAALSMAAYKEIGIKATFRDLGFSNIMTFSYNPDNDQIVLDRDIVASAFAIKKYIVDGDIYTIIAVVVRGTVQDEWYSNFDIGSGDTIHVGFNNGKKEVLDKLDAYRTLLERNHVETGNVKILVTGHSRGAAVADLVTLELNNNSKYAEYAYNDIFAYTFAAPHSIPTSMQCENTDNIYNIINDQDLVPHVPGAFYSPGYNLYMNCYDDPLFNQFQEKFDELVRTASYKRWERLGIAVLKLFDFMPVENLSGEYGTLMADLMLGKISPESWIKIITTYDKKVLDWIVAFVSGSEDEIAKDIVYFLGAVSIASVSREYVEERIWANHAMETYMCWLNVISDGRGFSKAGFNDSLQQEVFNGALLEMLTILKIRCPVNVYVYDENQNHQLVTSIENNTVTLDDGPFCLVSGEEKIFHLSNDDNYTFEIVGYDEGQMDIEVREFGVDGQQTKFILYDNLQVKPQGKAVLTAENCATEWSEYSLATDEGVPINPDYSAAGDQIGTLELSISIEGSGFAIGAGRYTPGETVVVYALADESTFEGWYQDGELISSEEFYEFTILESVELVAKFVDQAAGHTHVWSTAWTNNSTHHWHECTAQGCGIASDSGKGGYAAHSSGEWIIDQEATSTVAGRQHKECTTCGYVMETETIPAAGGEIPTPPTSDHNHAWSAAWSSSITHHWHECTAQNCGITYDRDKNGYTTHSSGEWIIDQKATSTTAGQRHKECTTCGYVTETEILPSTGNGSSNGGGSSSSGHNSGSSSGSSTSALSPNRGSTGSATATTPTPSTPSSIFIDVPSSHTFAAAIAWARDNDIMGGYSDGTFRPDSNTNRQQMWMVLARMVGLNPGNMTEARTWAVNSGISDGTNPQNPMSRQQLVTMLYRFAQQQGMTISGSADLSAYPDNGMVASYATEALAWAVGNGIVTGTTDGRLNPEGTATRAHFAAFLYRYSTLTSSADLDNNEG